MLQCFICFVLSKATIFTFPHPPNDLVCVYGISTIVGYLMPNPVYAYVLNIYDL